MAVPSPKMVPCMSTAALLAALNDIQASFDASQGSSGEDMVRLLAIHIRVYRELRDRGMTELAIETFIMNLPNWPGR